MTLLDGAADALRELQASWQLVIISNQSGIARGRITLEEARAVHDRTMELFAAEGVYFAGAYYCPHGPDDGCRCRKPGAAMLVDAERELGVELAASAMVGDKPSDVEAGQAAGCSVQLLFARWIDVVRALR